jgi:hypothetical protein
MGGARSNRGATRRSGSTTRGGASKSQSRVATRGKFERLEGVKRSTARATSSSAAASPEPPEHQKVSSTAAVAVVALESRELEAATSSSSPEGVAGLTCGATQSSIAADAVSYEVPPEVSEAHAAEVAALNAKIEALSTDARRHRRASVRAGEADEPFHSREIANVGRLAIELVHSLTERLEDMVQLAEEAASQRVDREDAGGRTASVTSGSGGADATESIAFDRGVAWRTLFAGGDARGGSLGSVSPADIHTRLCHRSRAALDELRGARDHLYAKLYSPLTFLGRHYLRNHPMQPSQEDGEDDFSVGAWRPAQPVLLGNWGNSGRAGGLLSRAIEEETRVFSRTAASHGHASAGLGGGSGTVISGGYAETHCYGPSEHDDKFQTVRRPAGSWTDLRSLGREPLLQTIVESLKSGTLTNEDVANPRASLKALLHRSTPMYRVRRVRVDAAEGGGEEGDAEPGGSGGEGASDDGADEWVNGGDELGGEWWAEPSEAAVEDVDRTSPHGEQPANSSASGGEGSSGHGAARLRDAASVIMEGFGAREDRREKDPLVAAAQAFASPSKQARLATSPATVSQASSSPQSRSSPLPQSHTPSSPTPSKEMMKAMAKAKRGRR